METAKSGTDERVGICPDYLRTNDSLARRNRQQAIVLVEKWNEPTTYTLNGTRTNSIACCGHSVNLPRNESEALPTESRLLIAPDAGASKFSVVFASL